MMSGERISSTYQPPSEPYSAPSTVSEEQDCMRSIGRLSTSAKNKEPAHDKRCVKFVVNPIIYVGKVNDAEESADSSDDECFDSEEKEKFDKLEIKEDEDLPYRPFKITDKGKKEPVGFLTNEEVNSSNLSPSALYVALAFVDKLVKNGLENDDPKEVGNVVSVTMLLNRPISVSTRENNLLENKWKLNWLEEGTISINNIKVHLFGIFWEFQWYNDKNKKVPFKEVRQYYKKLKTYDKFYNQGKAQLFKNKAEKEIGIPYRALREHAKKCVNIKKMAEYNENCDVYLSVVDGDTIDFNGVYSAYRRIHAKYPKPPRVMSTGYLFPLDKNDGEVYRLASEFDRKVRIITNHHIPGGVYYPEPNTCILIPEGENTISECFFHQKKDKKKQREELAYLLKQIPKTDNDFIFDSDNPLITKIPDRAKMNKAHKTSISFTEDFKHGASPTKSDIRKLKQVTQSHYHDNVWYNCLFVNYAIKPDGQGANFICKGLLKKIRRGTEEEKNEAAEEIKKHITPTINDTNHVIEKIIHVSKAVNELVESLERSNIRGETETLLFDILKDLGIKLDPEDQNLLHLCTEPGALRLLKKKLINQQALESIKSFKWLIFEFMFNDKVILEKLYKENRDLDIILAALYEHFPWLQRDRELRIIQENSLEQLKLLFETSNR